MTMVPKLGDKDHMASVHFGCLFCRCHKQVYYSGVCDWGERVLLRLTLRSLTADANP